MSKMPNAEPPIDILCITAHPDDELLCAGAIAHHARNGKSVVIAVVTDGAGGPPEYDTNMPGPKVAELRCSELLNSAQVLGVKHVEFMGFPNAGQESELTYDVGQVTLRIKEIIERYCPRIVLAHGPDGEYGHPDHKAASKCTSEAVSLLGKKYQPVLYYCRAYCAEAPSPRSNISVKANYVFPVTGRNHQARHQVACCHISQLQCFIGFFGSTDTRECYHRLGEANEDSAWFEVVPD